MSGSTTNNALKVLLKRFADGGPLMIQVFSGLTEEQCVAYPVPGTWSIAELAAHLVDCDLVFADRIKRILAEPNPTLLAFDENAWLANLNPNRLPVEDAVARSFASSRENAPWFCTQSGSCVSGKAFGCGSRVKLSKPLFIHPSTTPITSVEITTPNITATCCFHGVAPIR